MPARQNMASRKGVILCIRGILPQMPQKKILHSGPSTETVHNFSIQFPSLTFAAEIENGSLLPAKQLIIRRK